MTDSAQLITRTVLVAGSTGYVGGRLIPELLADGHTVRALARTPGKLRGRAFVDDPKLEVVRGDVTDAASLAPALDGVEVAYYLVHSMGSSHGAGFADADLAAARTFGSACATAGVERIVYLSGLGDENDDTLSEHLRSRHDTGHSLREAGVPVTELRAAIIVGSGSASYQMIHDLSKKLPLMLTPKWVQNRCEPIAIRDVTWYLRAVLDAPRTVGETLEIGSGDVHTYEGLMRICAEELGISFRAFTVPVFSPRLSSYWVHLVTHVDKDMARPLIEGLRSDIVCTDTRIREWLPRELSPYRLAVQRALAKQASTKRESAWSDAQVRPLRGRGQAHKIRLQPSRPVFRDYRTFDTDLTPEQLYARVELIGGAGGYGERSDVMWRLRGILDRVFGGPGLTRGRPPGAELYEGDPVDWWRVEKAVPPRQLRLIAEMRAPGRARLDFRVEPLPDGGTRLHQYASLVNESLLSGMYWLFIVPFHARVFAELGEHVIGGEHLRTSVKGAAERAAHPELASTGGSVEGEGPGLGGGTDVAGGIQRLDGPRMGARQE